jgi:hypothetical protein
MYFAKLHRPHKYFDSIVEYIYISGATNKVFILIMSSDKGAKCANYDWSCLTRA